MGLKEDWKVWISILLSNCRNAVVLAFWEQQIAHICPGCHLENFWWQVGSPSSRCSLSWVPLRAPWAKVSSSWSQCCLDILHSGHRLGTGATEFALILWTLPIPAQWLPEILSYPTLAASPGALSASGQPAQHSTPEETISAAELYGGLAGGNRSRGDPGPNTDGKLLWITVRLSPYASRTSTDSIQQRI